MLAAQIFYSASAASLAINAVPGRGIVAVPRVAQPIVMEEAVIDEAFGASHTSFYTDAVKKEKYDTLEEVLAEKLADKELATVVNTMFDACGTITEALRVELVTVADEQSSVFGDVQLGVDVVADNLMWDVCKTTPLIKEGASEEEPEVRQMHADGKFCICWDPLDGSAIIDNNWGGGHDYWDLARVDWHPRRDRPRPGGVDGGQLRAAHDGLRHARRRRLRVH